MFDFDYIERKKKELPKILDRTLSPFVKLFVKRVDRSFLRHSKFKYRFPS